MDVLTLSRVQFGSTAAFHILWPVMSIGLALYMLAMEIMWLKTGHEKYYRQTRFWTKIFVLTFAIGVASGFPLAFQFGTNWAAFSKAAGGFFGNMLGFETTIAFTLETASLGILIFGWNRVSPLIHVLSNFFVLVGASLSAFWIMVANSWMQVAIGTHFADGEIVVDSHLAAILNSETFASFSHMYLASVETTLFMMGGIAAWQLLRRDREAIIHEFFYRTFLYVFMIALVVTPLQIVVGDWSGTVVANHQPEKLAALELNWDTNAPGTGAPWSLVAIPNRAGTGNAASIDIPNGLSLVTTHSLTGTVPGLNSFPTDDRPNVVEAMITYYAFRVMLAIGFFLFGLALYTGLLWWRGRLTLAALRERRWLLRAWVFALPLGFIATEAGWMVREIGRQPWIIYHSLRVSDGLSHNLNLPVMSVVLVAIAAIYTVLIGCFLYFSWRTIEHGPDLTSPLPHSH